MTADGVPVNPADVRPDQLVVIIEETLVMSREQAAREGREILGPAEDTRVGTVRVADD